MNRLLPVSAALLALGAAFLASPAHADHVNVSPIPALSGHYAGTDAVGVDIDASGGRYVVSNNHVRYFPRGSTTATRDIYGANTGASYLSRVSVDGDGYVHVIDSSNSTIRIFAPGATGNVAPVRTISGSKTLISELSDIDVDTAGYIHVTDRGADSLSTFAPSAKGNAAPIWRIVGPRAQLENVTGVERRGSKFYVASPEADAVLVFSVGHSGDVGPERVIGGSRSGLDSPVSVTLDDAGHIYVLADTTYHLAVFAPVADGNATPLRTAQVTGRSIAYDVAIDRWRNLTLANIYSGTTDQLAPLMTTVASVPRTLKVSGATTATTRTFSWTTPAADGYTPVTGYQVVVKSGSTVKYSVTRTASQRSLTLARSKLGTGTKVAHVRAKNAKGYGPWSKVSFTVR